MHQQIDPNDLLLQFFGLFYGTSTLPGFSKASSNLSAAQQSMGTFFQVPSSKLRNCSSRWFTFESVHDHGAFTHEGVKRDGHDIKAWPPLCVIARPLFAIKLTSAQLIESRHIRYPHHTEYLLFQFLSSWNSFLHLPWYFLRNLTAVYGKCSIK